ncbi:MAG: anthranilate/aminodeoxychorismate synthase component II, partial [Gammaproteobacteria bacterium]|nr:anthranilate/aminodeoxychorismate synthase component II [Gammaproteobacteria bacterium]
QSLGQVFCGKIVHANQIMHGQTSMMHHSDKGVFAGLPQPFEATRYHSLVIEKTSIPDDFEITAWTENENGELDEIMGVIHKPTGAEGVQFHPESILTRCGHDLLANFLKR